MFENVICLPKIVGGPKIIRLVRSCDLLSKESFAETCSLKEVDPLIVDATVSSIVLIRESMSQYY